jgi:hypothetical protein
VLVPDFLRNKVKSDPETDETVRRYICNHYAFAPTMDFVLSPVGEEQLLSWAELLIRIPELIRCQLTRMGI